ncbi:DNA methyltransferase [Brevibacterium sp. SMBL_HHYL_HB1]|uniref:DNA-methyltransferase n=1 Tax=Brevibacterium sp. SMBL_HHYL_HB1 TaxID=2777556 RepID=UPI001BA7FE1E|nr:DNA methyltransferase [Brevibacterium sp. SMBL_HHYL_HB1]QUL80643.1 site-specific DNA-methyltransferase [Brevibacterium sp. SMBL_HHYL_HB1]
MSTADTAPAVIHAEALEHLRTLPSESIDAIITDPPYGLSATSPAQVIETLAAWAGGDREHMPAGRGFMSLPWDAFVPPPALWDECFRILKPGGHLAAFAGSRTYDLMGMSVRLAGFEIRDGLAWLYGSGMPHRQDVAKAVEAQVTLGGSSSASLKATEQSGDGEEYTLTHQVNDIMAEKTATTTRRHWRPTAEDAQRWQGWTTGLKPAHEPIVLARKPLAETSVARNVLAHSTGALNTDACRVAHRSAADLEESSVKNRHAHYGTTPGGNHVYGDYSTVPKKDYDGSRGRHPANVVLTHAADCQHGADGQVCAPACPVGGLDDGAPTPERGPSRFFTATEAPYLYHPKARASERPRVQGEDGSTIRHMSVKPLGVMRWLVRLLTPPGGTVLDPFAGSGTTLEAAQMEGFASLGIEREADYIDLIHRRLRSAAAPA